jgi:hypothetical protein
MQNTGFLDISGTDLINLYCTDLSATTFTGLNVFGPNGIIAYKAPLIEVASTLTYTASNIPNLIFARGSNIAITFNLPTTGVSNGFMLQFRRNNGTGSVTYSFSPNIFNLSNTSVSSISTAAYSFGLIKYNTNWYLHYLL